MFWRRRYQLTTCLKTCEIILDISRLGFVCIGFLTHLPANQLLRLIPSEVRSTLQTALQTAIKVYLLLVLQYQLNNFCALKGSRDIGLFSIRGDIF